MMNILLKFSNEKFNVFPIFKRFLCKNMKEVNAVKDRDDCKNDISVGLVGGGMSLIYTGVLLKQIKKIRSINIVDTSESVAAAAYDTSHIDTKTKIKYYRKSSLKEALSKVNVIALMDDGDGKILCDEPKIQLMMSSNYVNSMMKEISAVNSSALLAILVRPVTATLPLVSKILKQKKSWNPNKIIGSVALDVMRIESMTADLFHLNPAFLSIPVVGGADPSTTVPLLSRVQPLNHISTEHEQLLINRLRCCDKELEYCSDDFKGPTMSSGAAAAKFISTIVRALSGESNATCCAYVSSNVIPFCPFFTNEVELGPEGIKTNYGLPKVSALSIDLIHKAIPIINELSEIGCKSVESEKKV